MRFLAFGPNGGCEKSWVGSDPAALPRSPTEPVFRTTCVIDVINLWSRVESSHHTPGYVTSAAPLRFDVASFPISVHEKVRIPARFAVPVLSSRRCCARARGFLTCSH
jgi:hypothetical protein